MAVTKTKIQKVFIVILLLFVMIGNVKKIKKEFKKTGKNEVDVAIQYEQKLCPVKPLLVDYDHIGFTSDEKDMGEYAESLYLTQYVLSPKKIIAHRAADLEIGAFNNPSLRERFIEEKSLKMVKQIDDKMALYERSIH